MKKVTTEIICVIDKSGSMATVVNDAIGGFNAFLKAQKELPEEAVMTLVLFDTEYILKHDGVRIKDVPTLDGKTYVPAGSTALLDAVGRTIDDVGARLANTPECERPEKMIMAILTDGEENSSKIYSRAQICDRIKHQTDIYKWEFVFLGANQDAFKSATSIGIEAANTMPFVGTGAGLMTAFGSINNAISSFRLNGKIDKNWKK